ncbi:unnamed protein product [Closterium sp. Naga37s-1]|nr:unnamed protein product [Closterium sp. Naga37s-1]
MASRTSRSSGAGALRTASRARPPFRIVSPYGRCIPFHAAVLITALTIAASMGLVDGLTSAKDVDALGDIYSGFNRSATLQTWTWGDPCGSDGSENAGSPWHGITCDVSADPQRVIEMYVAPTAAAAAAVG